METLQEILYKEKLPNSPTPILDKEILLSKVIKRDRKFIACNRQKTLTPSQIKNFHKLLNRRKNREPIAYIINSKEFFGREFYVNSEVLIPRPETELLVERALGIIRKENTPLTILDIGTGSGCIAINIAKELELSNQLEEKQIIASDISPKALAIAKRNYKKHFNSTSSHIKFIKSNLLTNLPDKIDLIISNLPYIGLNNYKHLERNVVDFEPKLALVGGIKGYELIQELLNQAKEKVSPKFSILLEINFDQGKIISQYAKTIFPKSKIIIVKDYAKLDRFVEIRSY